MMFIGVALILVGGFFVLRNFGVIPFWYGWHELWPVVIIAVGAALIAEAAWKKRK